MTEKNKTDSIILQKTQKDIEYPTSRLSAKFEPVNQLAFFKEAEKFLSVIEKSKLTVIAEQIKYLQDQARKIIMDSEKNFELHKATCNFIKRSGHIYHLYAKPDDSLYFSLISPSEWNNNPPHVYKGSYRLEDDYSWSSLEEECL